MSIIRTLSKRFIADESGASAVEYGILVATIILLMAVGLNTYPPALAQVFNAIAVAISGA